MSMHPNRNLFKEFKGDSQVFIETGSYRGDGIQLALDAGFEKIISIDIEQENIDFCKNRFDLFRKPNPNITLIAGNSGDNIYKVVSNINETAVFWLDAHWQVLEGTEPGPEPFPLLKELISIRLYGRRMDHTIIIDDILHLTHPDVTGWDKKRIEGEILAINSNYKLEYFANPVINNILVAHV